jgi:hypothetical protein
MGSGSSGKSLSSFSGLSSGARVSSLGGAFVMN